ncbi:CRISPR-associated helicase Cas3' [Phaeodactylibacter luteus]|nr:CRISPR-associated helicase Cas3' [Phaeodactylibacter luteus]
MPLSPEKSKLRLAKPDGLSYEEHVRDVREKLKEIGDSFPIAIYKYANWFGDDNLLSITDQAVIYHDEGKLNPCWQLPCQKDYQAYVKWASKQNREVTHTDFERECRDEAGKNLRLAKFRHEIGSLVIHGRKLPLRVKAAIAAHHGKLSKKDEARWLEVKDGFYYLEKLYERSYSVDDNFKATLIEFLKFSGPRAWLQIADRRASAMEGGNPHPEIIPFRYHFPITWTRRPVQQLAEDNYREDLLVFRAPTGAGKTSAALLWAKKQIETRRAERLVIAMPTRFTSTAMALSTEDDISEVGLYHSSAKFVERKHRKVTNQTFDAHSLYARWLMTPVTICTVDHLLMSLTLTREDHHITSFNLANSCLVIDEADAYDDFVRQNMAVLLQACKHWKVPVLFMSASIADCERDFFREIGYGTVKILEDDSEYEQEQCRLSGIEDFEQPEDIEHLLAECIAKEAAIIYVNTVDRAVQLFRNLKDQVTDVPIFLYHSRFLEKDKRQKEEAILQALGKAAWEEGKARGIVIMTQIGEMSINISAEIMLSELCPIDRLVQRVGRLCRFTENKKPGSLFILRPIKNGYLYPPPYGSYEQKKKSWIPLQAFTQTLQKLETGKVYRKGSWIKLINEIYPVYNKDIGKARINSESLKELFRNNWLVRFSASSKAAEEEGSSGWRARDIDPQRTVLILDCYEKDGYFTSWGAYYHFQSTNGISIPLYLAERGLKNKAIVQLDLYINGDKQDESVFVVNGGSYNFDVGLILDEDSSFI